MTVTPTLARTWLTAGRSQPHVDPGKVRRYAQVMTAGRWRADGEPVVFRPDGSIVQGHHRLAAVAVAGVPVQMPVTNPPVPGRTATTGRRIQSASTRR